MNCTDTEFHQRGRVGAIEACGRSEYQYGGLLFEEGDFDSCEVHVHNTSEGAALDMEAKSEDVEKNLYAELPPDQAAEFVKLLERARDEHDGSQRLIGDVQAGMTKSVAVTETGKFRARGDQLGKTKVSVSRVEQGIFISIHAEGSVGESSLSATVPLSSIQRLGDMILRGCR